MEIDPGFASQPGKSKTVFKLMNLKSILEKYWLNGRMRFQNHDQMLEYQNFLLLRDVLVVKIFIFVYFFNASLN